MNRNNPMFFDVYSCDLETGELTLLQENPGMTEEGCMILGYMTDEDMNIRGMAAIDPEVGTIVFYLKDVGEAEWEEFVSFSALDTVSPQRFSEDGRGIYYQSNLESNTTALFYQDLDTGEITEIAHDSLAGVTFTPDLYCAGVDFFGPSNLITFRETVPPYWKPMGAIMDIRVGDMDEDSLMLEERSPLNYVEYIRVPMLIVQGVNDPRVVQAESDQMVAALRENGNEVYYVLYDNEGHGFAIEANRLEFAGRVEEFLYNHVPGVECQLFEEIPNSTAIVR